MQDKLVQEDECGNAVLCWSDELSLRFMPEEQWRPCLGFEEEYLVSDMGRIKSQSTGDVLKPWRGRKTRPRVSLYKGGRKTNIYLYEVVLSTFVCPRPEGCFSCHLDDDFMDNRLSNLIWGTQSDNERHKKENKNRRIKKNDRSYLLTDKEIAYIHVKTNMDPEPMDIVAQYALYFNVPRSTIWLIMHNQAIIPVCSLAAADQKVRLGSSRPENVSFPYGV